MFHVIDSLNNNTPKIIALTTSMYDSIDVVEAKVFQRGKH